MKSVMTHQFSQVPKAEIQRSSFDRSHGLKTAFNAGLLVPVYVDEALPGDTFNLRMNAFARLATPIKPIMDNMFLDSFFFAVPIRLIWDNFKKFMGEQINPGDSTSFTVPYMTAPAVTGALKDSLSDYMGIPTGIASLQFNSLHHRAYNLIWNEWFRDENLQNSITVDKGDGPDTYANYAGLQRRGKRHDYFTSCLPWPQKGPDVLLPLGSSAPVKGDQATQIKMNPGVVTDVRGVSAAAGTNALSVSGAGFGGAQNMTWPANTALGLYADLTSATASTINAIRQAFQLQKLYERDARGGTRYIEIVKSHFLVDSPDLRATRPEYLGGGSTQINFHPVAQTAPTAAGSTPQGNLSAFATGGINGHGFTKSFTEHCVLIGLVSVRADLTYQKGLDRMWSRRTRFDFYWPALAHIGEQAVLNKEIYCQGTADDALTFGYQERFAEYRYKPSVITSIFRSNAAGTLDYWHLSQNFTALPTLGSTFIQEDPPVARVIAVASEPQFLFDSYFSLKCARPMPTYSVPGLVDHF